MTMYIWNPSKFKIGEAGRSSCPQWHGRAFSFEPNETKEVEDKCGRWLISAFSYYGLVSLPDRNIVKDSEKYDLAVKKMKVHGIQNLYKWAQRVIADYRELAKKCVDARERIPEVNNYVLQAFEISKEYRADIQLSDPEMIKRHKIQREIMGSVEHDSDKSLDRAFESEIRDRNDNDRQYSGKLEDVKINDSDTPKDEKAEDIAPAEPVVKKEKTDEEKIELAAKQAKLSSTKPKTTASKTASKVESTVENMKNGIDLSQSAI